MGRFYRTSSAAPIDYMYKLDAPLMEKALMANDQYITQSREDAAQIGTLADSYNYLAGDTEDAQAIIGGYKKRVNDIASAIQADPANWRKQTNPINALRQDFITDYKTGAISKQIGNYDTRKKWFDEVDKQVEAYNKSGGRDKDGNDIGISPERAAAYKRYADEHFTKTGYDKNNPNAYNVYKPEQIMGNINIKKRLSDGFEKLKADGKIDVRESLTGGQQYFNKVTNEWEGLTQDRILNLVMDNFAGDSQLQQYLQADTRVGAMSGIYYPTDVTDPITGSVVHRAGELISPFNSVAHAITPTQQAEIDIMQNNIKKIKNPAIKAQEEKLLKDHIKQLEAETDMRWNSESSLAPIFRGIVGQYSYMKTKSENDLSNNSLYNTMYTQGQENARFKQTMDFNKQKEDNASKQFDDMMKYRYYVADKSKDGTGTKATDKKAQDTLPVETAVSVFATRNFKDWMTKDINGVPRPVLSPEGLTGDMVSFTKQINDNEAQLRDIQKTLDNAKSPSDKLIAETLKENLLKKNVKLKSDLALRRDWYGKTTDAVLNNDPDAGAPLSKEDIELFKEFRTDRSGEKYQKYIDKLKQDYPDVPIPVNKNAGGLPFGSANTDVNYLPSKEVQLAQDKLARYRAANARVIKNQTNILNSIREKNTITSDAIIPNKQESTELRDMFLANHAGAEIFDDKGNKGDGISLRGRNIFGVQIAASHGGSGGNLTFNNDELIDYMIKNNVDMIPTKIGASTGIGNGGTVMEVNFNDPTGKLSGQNFYITLPPELTADIATKYKSHKNPVVKNIANSISDVEATNLRLQFAKPKVNNLLNNGDTEQSFDITAPAPNGKLAKLTVTKLSGTDQVTVTYKDRDGISQPYPRSRRGREAGVGLADGKFGGTEDAVQNILDITHYGQ